MCPLLSPPSVPPSSPSIPPSPVPSSVLSLHPSIPCPLLRPSVLSPVKQQQQRVYRALYDYAAQDHDEVSFRDGDVIINAQHIDEGWMYGTVQRTGKSGMLPANYVETAH
ncbi:hypothetical protein WMY93_033640 [Mugilogobius chulae]|uniref:SH3 domain-containing protein n=1 Tax=Mugilogobius chulae TaxID=88201 RepID=A0AAW0MK38_9GOBI